MLNIMGLFHFKCVIDVKAKVGVNKKGLITAIIYHFQC